MPPVLLKVLGVDRLLVGGLLPLVGPSFGSVRNGFVKGLV